MIINVAKLGSPSPDVSKRGWFGLTSKPKNAYLWQKIIISLYKHQIFEINTKYFDINIKDFDNKCWIHFWTNLFQISILFLVYAYAFCDKPMQVGDEQPFKANAKAARKKKNVKHLGRGPSAESRALN